MKYDNRPFKDVYEMNDAIVKRHNERVKDEDTMYYLGDFAFYASQNRAFRGEGQPYSPKEILDKMNGNQWYFVAGNHDTGSNKFKPKARTIILNQNGLNIQLIHDPTYAKIDYDLILCGHIHNLWKIKELHYCGQTRLMINVGCCAWKYYPVKLEEALAIYYRWKSERSKIKHRWQPTAISLELNKGFGTIE
jgi:calcineurin-like phosphoesterase family protein